MMAYTESPHDSCYVHIDGPNGGCTGYDGSLPFWEYVRPIGDGPYMITSRPDRDQKDPRPDAISDVIAGQPPAPEGGWQIGDEVCVRTICYAGPQWEYRLLRLTAGKNPGYSCSPVGRIAYGQRLF